MSNIEKNENKKVKGNGFFKDVLKSIKDFDKYEDFGLEGVGKTSGYLIKLVVIFTIVITCMTVYKFSNSVKEAINYFDAKVTDLSYADGILTVNNNEKFEVASDKYITGKIIVDTENLSDEKIEEYKNQIKNQNNGLVLLKDKMLLKNEMLSAISETSYTDFFNKYNITSLDKQKIIDYVNNNSLQIYTSVFVTMFIYMFVVYLASILVDALVLGFLAYLIARIFRMKIKYSASFSMSVHALTLSIILNMVYIIINGFTGWTVKYFQFMYTAISYIYIVTAILMIKTDYMKRQAEVEKIKSVQEQVKEKIKQKDCKKPLNITIMPILYEAYQSNLENKDKKKLFYPRVVRTGKVGTEQIAKEVAGYSSLSAGDVKNTIDNLVTVMTQHLQASETVSLDGLGNFRITMIAKGKGVETADDVSASQAKLYMRFTSASTLNSDRTKATRSLLTGAKCKRFDRKTGAVSGEEENPDVDNPSGGGIEGI